MSKWKGLLKCNLCGRLLDADKVRVLGFHYANMKATVECTGKLVPHDRRTPDPRMAALVKASTRLLHACERADEDGDLPECVDGAMIDDLRFALAAFEEESHE